MNRTTSAKVVIRFPIAELDAAKLVAARYRADAEKPKWGAATRIVFRGPRRQGYSWSNQFGRRYLLTNSFTLKADATHFDLYLF